MSQQTSRAESLSKAAAKLASATERVAFLERECAGDEELRDAVEVLLGSGDESGAGLHDTRTVLDPSDATMRVPEAETAVAAISPQPAPRVGVTPGPARDVAKKSPVTLPQEEYQVGDEIARGGMGSILEAEDRKLGRKVAMKVMRLDASASEDARGRFVREATVLARLEHPNIVPIHELGWDAEGRLFYTMKLVQGRTLQAILNGLRGADTPVRAESDPDFTRYYTLDRLLTIFRKICDALSMAHAKGIIHRDLKPENVMVGEFGEVLVMDWGIAKILGDAAQVAEESARKAEATAAGTAGKFRDLADEELRKGSAEMTMDGTVMGTPHYMSPEQAEGQVSEIDQQSDVFSLGAILYALLTLHPPVEASSIREVLERIKRGDILPPTDFNAPTKTGGTGQSLAGTAADPKKFQPLAHCPGGKVPMALSSVAMKALTVDKARRYATVAAFAADVEKYQGGFATSAEQAGLFTQLRLLVQRHKREFAIGLAAWLVITTLGVWFVINLRAKERRAIAGEQKAVASEAIAKSEAERARAAEKLATEREEATRRALAKARIAVADAAYRSNNAPEIRRALQEVPEDLRDADWSYLFAKSDGSIATVEKGVELISVAAHPKEPGVFAVSGADGKITVLRARTGEKLVEFTPAFSDPKGKRFRMAFSPDGERIAIGHEGKGILICNARDGTKLAEWDSRKTGDLHFSPDGKLLLQQINEPPSKSFALWDAASGQQLWSRWSEDSKEKNLEGAVFTPNGKEIACIRGLTFPVFSVRDGTELRELKPRPELKFPQTIAMAPDGNLIVAGGFFGEVLGISLKDGNVPFRGRVHDRRNDQLVFTPDGNRFVAVAVLGDGRQSIQLWNAKTGGPMDALLGGSANAAGVSVHPLSGEMLVTGKDSRLWNVATAPEVWTSDKRGFAAQFWGSDEILFASKKGVAGGYPAELWDLRKAAMIWEPIPRDQHESVNISADGRYAALPGSPLLVLRRNDGTPEIVNAGLKCGFRNIVRLSPDGSKLIVQDAGNRCVVRDSVTGTKKCDLSAKGVDHFADLGWVADGARIVGLVTMNARRGAPTSEERIILWDSVTGEQLQSVVQPTAMDVLAVSPDGLSFAEAGTDRLVRVRDVATLAVKQQFRVHDDRITTLAWHPKKPILATGSADLSVKIWNLETGRSLEEFNGFIDVPNALSFSPSGTRLACSMAGAGTHVWEPVCLKESQGGTEPKAK